MNDPDRTTTSTTVVTWFLLLLLAIVVVGALIDRGTSPTGPKTTTGQSYNPPVATPGVAPNSSTLPQNRLETKPAAPAAAPPAASPPTPAVPVQ